MFGALFLFLFSFYGYNECFLVCFYFPFMAIMNVFWFVFIAFLELEVIWWGNIVWSDILRIGVSAKPPELIIGRPKQISVKYHTSANC
jgi:hypothetical protein